MGAFVEDAIRKSIKALVERDATLAIQVIDGDAIVNTFDVEIEEECIRFLAIWQPTGSNLRFVTTAIKIITDLERMGDLAVDICERSVELLDEPPLKPYIDIPRMADAAQKMLKDSLDAFVAKDADLAPDCLRGRRLRGQPEPCRSSTNCSSSCSRTPRTSRAPCASPTSPSTWSASADHATNIAEMVVYMVQGQGHPAHGLRDHAQDRKDLTDHAGRKPQIKLQPVTVNGGYRSSERSNQLLLNWLKNRRLRDLRFPVTL